LRLVVDASVAVSWCAVQQADASTWAAAAAVAERGGLVPPHFFLEVAAALRSLEQRDRLDAERLERFLSEILVFPFLVDDAAGRDRLPDTLRLSRRHRLTMYDAVYLELTLRAGAPLATRDQPLAAAARAAGAQLFVPP
jgi:predicted nucleic acid-binding protein